VQIVRYSTVVVLDPQGGCLSANPITPAPFDWKRPEYVGIFQQRTARLQRLRASLEALPQLKAYYRDHPPHSSTIGHDH
jgi:hypothetical protein